MRRRRDAFHTPHETTPRTTSLDAPLAVPKISLLHHRLTAGARCPQVDADIGYRRLRTISKLFGDGEDNS